jgi:hypothetical protein
LFILGACSLHGESRKYKDNLNSRLSLEVKKRSQISYGNKINNYARKYINLLYHNRCKLTTCFDHLLWPSSESCFEEEYFTRTTKQIYKCKRQTNRRINKYFIYVHLFVCLCNISFLNTPPRRRLQKVTEHVRSLSRI